LPERLLQIDVNKTEGGAAAQLSDVENVADIILG